MFATTRKAELKVSSALGGMETSQVKATAPEVSKSGMYPEIRAGDPPEKPPEIPPEKPPETAPRSLAGPPPGVTSGASSEGTSGGLPGTLPGTLPGGEIETVSAAELVRQISNGALQTADICVPRRQECVRFLMNEGFTTGDMAALLKTHERMVWRDRAAIRKEDALEPSETLGDELLGEYQALTRASVQRLARLSRDARTPAYARLWAEEAIVRVQQRFIETVHRLQYLSEGKTRITDKKYLLPAPPGAEAKLAVLEKILARGLEMSKSRGPATGLSASVSP